MIKEFVAKFDLNREKLREEFTAFPPDGYSSIVHSVIAMLHDEDEYATIDPERIHQIDDGMYQGTLLYVIADSSYQPDQYWSVMISYGSCSGCDTFQSIQDHWYYDEDEHDMRDDEDIEKEIDGYMMLALHVVQGLKEL